MEEKNISLKVPITHRFNPYIYVKMNNIDNKYRVSGNYKYLNKHYGLKINMIRNLKNIDLNSYFKVTNNSIQLSDHNWQHWQLGSNNNTLNISRLIVKKKNDNHTIIALTRNFEGDVNSSVFFCSKLFFNINQFLEEPNVQLLS